MLLYYLAIICGESKRVYTHGRGQAAFNSLPSTTCILNTTWNHEILLHLLGRNNMIMFELKVIYLEPKRNTCYGRNILIIQKSVTKTHNISRYLNSSFQSFYASVMHFLCKYNRDEVVAYILICILFPSNINHFVT